MKKSGEYTIGDVNINFFEHSGATRYEAVIDSDYREVLACLGSDKNIDIMNELEDEDDMSITVNINKYTDNTIKNITIYTDRSDSKRDVMIAAGLIAGLQYNK